MDASLLVAIASALVGVAGVLLALQADNRAKEANRIAKNALDTAHEANTLSGEANQLASDANAVSERALNVSAESIDYQWVFEIDDEVGRFTVRNESASEAVDVAVFIKSENGDVISDSDDAVAPTGEIHLYGEGMVQEHLERVRNADRKITAYFDAPVYGGRKSASTWFKCYLTWKSPRGKELSTVLDLTLRHRVSDGQGTIKRLD